MRRPWACGVAQMDSRRRAKVLAVRGASLKTRFALASVLMLSVAILVSTSIGLLQLERTSERLALESLRHRVETMEHLLTSRGPVGIREGLLVAGEAPIEGHYDIVDTIQGIYGGTATIFKYDVRVSTNVLKPDGSRAVGTRLVGPAFQAVFDRGTTYSGVADILGVPYYTHYKPLRDSRGETVGVLYAGVKQSEYRAGHLAMLWQGLLSAVIVIAGFSFVMWLLVRRITRAVGAVSGFAETLSEGDLRATVSITTGDEMEAMAHALEGMRAQIHSTIEEVSVAAEGLSHDGTRLSETAASSARSTQSYASSVEELTGTVEEIQGATDVINEHVGLQLDRIKGLAGRLEVLSRTATETAQRLAEARANTSRIHAQADRGGGLLDSMTAMMQEISSGSQRMQDITTIIDGISGKINLISINASIEAARAGDAGRGFAVVAEEISKLADQTARSIKDIDDLLRFSHGQVSQGLTRAHETAASMSSIVGEIASINGSIDALSAQAQSLESFRADVEGYASATVLSAEEIRASTVELQLAMRELAREISSVNQETQSSSAAAEEIRALSEAMDARAGLLKTLVDRFTV